MRKSAVVFFLAFWATQALAVNKCTEPDGSITYQNTPCTGNGVQIKVPIARDAAVVSPPETSTKKSYEIIKSDRIGREKWFVMNDARKALDFARSQCNDEQRKFAESKNLSNNNLAGATRDAAISQEMSAAAQMCSSRMQSLEKSVADAEKVCQEIKCIPPAT